jgi:hypothetical protein
MRVYQHPGLQGLEIWNSKVGDTTLDQLRENKPALYTALDNLLSQLHFENLILTGGGAATASPYIHHPHELRPDAARQGAEAIWKEEGWQNPVALDLGQTALKWYTPTNSGVIPRQLPHGPHAIPPKIALASLRDFLRPAIPKNIDGAILALPCAITEQGEAEPSTYPGLYGPIEPIFAELFPKTPWLVINDAVLAARATKNALTITLGYGIGAAQKGDGPL